MLSKTQEPHLLQTIKDYMHARQLHTGSLTWTCNFRPLSYMTSKSRWFLTNSKALLSILYSSSPATIHLANRHENFKTTKFAYIQRQIPRACNISQLIQIYLENLQPSLHIVKHVLQSERNYQMQCNFKIKMCFLRWY